MAKKRTFPLHWFYLTFDTCIQFQVGFNASLNKGCGISYGRSAATLAGIYDKLVYAPAVESRFAQICAKAIVAEG